VQWGQGPGAETTWEIAEDFNHTYPHFNLEGMVEVKGEGYVR